MCLGWVGEGPAEPSSWAAPATRPNKGVQAARKFRVQCAKVGLGFQRDKLLPNPGGAAAAVPVQPAPFRRAVAGRGDLARGAFPQESGEGAFLAGPCDL